MSDNVNHPPHYTRGGIETIDFIEAKELNWCLGNVVKYVSRAGHKGDKLEDLKKAAWYLRREIERLGGIAEYNKQIAELRQLLDLANQNADKWNASACKLQAELDEARKQFAELARQRGIGVNRPPDGWYDAACQLADQRDEARRQVVELTKQLVAAGLLQPTETEQCHG